MAFLLYNATEVIYIVKVPDSANNVLEPNPTGFVLKIPDPEQHTSTPFTPVYRTHQHVTPFLFTPYIYIYI